MSNINLYKREFASFSGKCPFACLHCYTYTKKYESKGKDSICDIVKSLEDKKPDIVYISGHRENFVVPDVGIELGEKLFDTYNCDILMTTRNIFDKKEIERLKELNLKMRSKGKDLFFCISIPALNSYKKLETSPFIPLPEERIDFLKDVYTSGVYTFLTVRPLCPNDFIPISEVLQIIERCKDYVAAVLSSGIIVDEYILKRLEDFPEIFKSQDGKLTECLKNNIPVKYVDVLKELKEIKALCESLKLPFYEHSMEAIQYVKSNRK